MDSLRFSWLEWLPWKPWRVVGVVEAADEIPTRLPPRGCVLVGTDKHPKWLAFDCPCRQGHRILVTLEHKQKPHWSVVRGPRLSLWPSIDAWQGSVRCHYIIRDGKTLWANN